MHACVRACVRASAFTRRLFKRFIQTLYSKVFFYDGAFMNIATRQIYSQKSSIVDTRLGSKICDFFKVLSSFNSSMEI